MKLESALSIGLGVAITTDIIISGYMINVLHAVELNPLGYNPTVIVVNYIALLSLAYIGQRSRFSKNLRGLVLACFVSALVVRLIAVIYNLGGVL